MRDKNKLKMNAEFHFDRGIIKEPSILVDRDALLSEFIIELYDDISIQFKIDNFSFEVLKSDFTRMAIIDNKEIYLFTEDETIEDLKKNGIRKLKFVYFNCSGKEFLTDEKIFVKVIQVHENMINEEKDK